MSCEAGEVARLFELHEIERQQQRMLEATNSKNLLFIRVMDCCYWSLVLMV